ncbi:uncharacterized protein LOC120276527 [Dioscorea cayenensis subsp. rotundata]|uniref:Uncharacterized protein LOC120276527 n=1 Tax=Dioscorea cayennensis subsp. rotundata TaxID=55577 RepID=A0AB40CGZ1_DIOCR|nr:uncharacterized protein LOC120276527 [Dioscorea cayenensis subsp. rotundata]
MLGMRRRTPLEHLELERASTKMPKEDALSIYELTLAKLRQGSRRAFEPSMKASSPDNLSASPDNPQQICDDPSTKNLKLIDSHSGE